MVWRKTLHLVYRSKLKRIMRLSIYFWLLACQLPHLAKSRLLVYGLM